MMSNTENSSLEQQLLNLKSAAYDCHRQIQFLTQIQLPQIEREIAEIEQKQTKEI